MSLITVTLLLSIYLGITRQQKTRKWLKNHLYISTTLWGILVYLLVNTILTIMANLQVFYKKLKPNHTLISKTIKPPKKSLLVHSPSLYPPKVGFLMSCIATVRLLKDLQKITKRYIFVKSYQQNVIRLIRIKQKGEIINLYLNNIFFCVLGIGTFSRNQRFLGCLRVWNLA